MVTNDSRYVSHHVIAARISRAWKDKTVNLDDIMEWCAEVEVSYMKDVDKMVQFYQVDLTVDTDNHIATLPCNVHRILDVYSDPNNSESAVNYYNDGVKLILNENYTQADVYINYVGQPISDEGEPLIIKGHENACETFCLIRLFEAESTKGQFPPQKIAEWSDKFSNQMTAARNDMRHFGRDYFMKLNIIKGNMVPKIGKIGLHHSQFTDYGSPSR